MTKTRPRTTAAGRQAPKSKLEILAQQPSFSTCSELEIWVAPGFLQHPTVVVVKWLDKEMKYDEI